MNSVKKPTGTPIPHLDLAKTIMINSRPLHKTHCKHSTDMKQVCKATWRFHTNPRLSRLLKEDLANHFYQDIFSPLLAGQEPDLQKLRIAQVFICYKTCPQETARSSSGKPRGYFQIAAICPLKPPNKDDMSQVSIDTRIMWEESRKNLDENVIKYCPAILLQYVYQDRISAMAIEHVTCGLLERAVSQMQWPSTIP